MNDDFSAEDQAKYNKFSFRIIYQVVHGLDVDPNDMFGAIMTMPIEYRECMDIDDD